MNFVEDHTRSRTRVVQPPTEHEAGHLPIVTAPDICVEITVRSAGVFYLDAGDDASVACSLSSLGFSSIPI